MSVYLDIKSLYPHLKVKLKRVIVSNLYCAALGCRHFPVMQCAHVPFPSGTLVAHRMGNGSIACAGFLQHTPDKSFPVNNFADFPLVWVKKSRICLVIGGIGISNVCY